LSIAQCCKESFKHPRWGGGGRVSPENAREHAIFEKTRTISSFSIVFLRKSANSVAETVQIFAHFPAGKIERHEITVDQDVIETRGGGTAATIPPACGRYAQEVEAYGDDGECRWSDRQIHGPTF
jgi:hypothetical protein